MQNTIRILSIDGGGIKGIIPLTFLSALQQKMGIENVVDKFHLVAGTSTGGIVALGLGSGVKVEEMSDMYLKRGSEIFSRSLWRRGTSISGLFRAKYDVKSMEKVFQEILGDKTQKDLSLPTLIASYDLIGMRPFFFQSWKAKDPELQQPNFKLTDIARATSAAPTFFDPKNVSIGGKKYTFIDGGVTANDPSTCAFAAARSIFYARERGPNGEPKGMRGVQVLSLGTGDYTKELDPWSGGAAGFGVSLLSDVMLRGNVQVAEYQLTHIFEALKDNEQEVGKREYLRIQPQLTEDLSEMDNYKNAGKLQQVALDYLKTDKGQSFLENWAQFLESDRVPLDELYRKDSLRGQ